MSEWIKCSERLPPEDKWVLGCFTDFPDEMMVTCLFKHDKKLLWLGNEYALSLESISHWRDLPKPPETEG